MTMTTSASSSTAPAPDDPSVDDAVARACARVAPTWPLDRFIAVNPLWGSIDRPLPEVAAALCALSSARMLMPRAWYREAWREGRFGDAHLREALTQLGATVSLGGLHALLERDEPATARRARFMDVADARHDLTRETSWRAFVVNSISQLCAAYFDEGQASLGPDRDGGLYACWRRYALGDRAPSLLMGLRAYRDIARGLPTSAHAMVQRALADLDVLAPERERYLAGLLLDVNGWASWCAYRRWTARLAGGDDDTLVELLAVRLAWEWTLQRASDDGVARRWQLAMAAWPQVDEAARVAGRRLGAAEGVGDRVAGGRVSRAAGGVCDGGADRCRGAGRVLHRRPLRGVPARAGGADGRGADARVRGLLRAPGRVPGARCDPRAAPAPGAPRPEAARD